MERSTQIEGDGTGVGCGHRLSTRYCGSQGRATYMCHPNVGRGACWSVSAPAIDRAVSTRFLHAIQPPDIELSLAVLREAEHQAKEVDRQWTLRLERARYEAQLAERRYKAVDPDHRVVARTQEREWNDKLVEVERVEREYHEVRGRETLALAEEDRARILALAKDLPAVWHAETTTPAERKDLLRMVVREVTVSPIEVPARLTRVPVLWQTGAASDFTVPRKDKYTAQATPAETLALILNAKSDPPHPPSGTRIGREGVAAAALTLRWGSYLAVLLDDDKPVSPEAGAPGTSGISDEEMARINDDVTRAAQVQTLSTDRLVPAASGNHAASAHRGMRPRPFGGPAVTIVGQQPARCLGNRARERGGWVAGVVS